MEAVLFDMDGTLLDTLQDLDTSVNHALAKAGLPAVSMDETRRAAGYGSIVLIDELTHHAFPTGSEAFAAVLDCFSRHYNAHHDDATRPYDGIMELLEGLSSRGLKMAVVSNKIQKDTEQLRELYFSRYIDVAIGRRDDVAPKPAPDMAQAACELLGVQPASCCYVGDSEPDVQLARNAGCMSVGCTWGFRSCDVLAAENPDYLIEHPLQLLDIVDALERG